jgi:hypothetical protein
MIGTIAVSLFSGIIVGLGYGLLFINRIRTYFASTPNEDLSFLPKKSLAVLFSFISSYCLAGISLYILMHSFHVNLMWSMTSFLGAFWFMVWRYTKKLS